MLETALELHEAGWWVVPQAGKRAVPFAWDRFRLSDDDVRAYFSDGRLNLAIALHQSPVIDVECDSDDSEVLLQELCAGAGGPPPTPTWRSRRGLHRLFLRPDPCPDKAVAHVRGVEFRLGRGPRPGALTTLPPSVHPDTGVAYEWLPGLSLSEVEPAPLPEPLAKLLVKTPKRGFRDIEDHEDEDIVEGGGAAGGRNNWLYREGCKVQDRGVDVAVHLAGANAQRCKPPVDEAELASIVASVHATAERQKVESSPLYCNSWDTLLKAWEEALEWRPDLAEVLSIMLAVVCSTKQTGDQLFLQVVGEPGSAKSVFCDALLVSTANCIRLEKAKGFFSGFMDFKDPEKDFSFVARANGHTLITPEADIFMSSPGAIELMSEQRRIFDGSASTSFKNRDRDTVYQGLRMPWIMAGTPAMFTSHQGHLGDRFLRVRMLTPDEPGKAAILRKVGRTAWDAVCQESNCSPDSTTVPAMSRAKRLTGGYVDWFRAGATDKLMAVREGSDEGDVIEDCRRLADFAALMRSRPPDRTTYHEPDYEPIKELPSRLQHQFVRMAACLAVVRNRPGVGDDVMRTIRRLALDTSKGRTLSLTGWLWKAGREGACPETVAIWSRETDDRVRRWLTHMEKVGGAVSFEPAVGGVGHSPRRWRLSERVRKLYEEVMGASANEEVGAVRGPRATARSIV